jgi:hypothetical protein
MTQIILFSGTIVDLSGPSFDCVSLQDIAHGLAHLCRFTGHTRRFYSVAEHSVHVSYLVPEPLAVDALLHDAHEALIGDVSSPLKPLLPDYQALESRVQEGIRRRFKVSIQTPQEVVRADKTMLDIELTEAVGTDSPFQPCRMVQFLSPERAKTLFLKRAHELQLF